MDRQIPGIHHVTAIASDPQQNVDFYTRILGLRLVKLTVNFDDPGTYHLYYGDERGQPGTILTFFPWRGARQGREGTGQATATGFSVPGDSIGFWSERLDRAGVVLETVEERFGLEFLPFRGMGDVAYRVLSGHIPPGQIGGVLLHQLAWTAAMVALGRFLLTRGTRRLVVQGG